MAQRSQKGWRGGGSVVRAPTGPPSPSTHITLLTTPWQRTRPAPEGAEVLSYSQQVFSRAHKNTAHENTAHIPIDTDT